MNPGQKGDFLAHAVTFGDIMAGNFMAGEFLGGYRLVLPVWR